MRRSLLGLLRRLAIMSALVATPGMAEAQETTGQLVGRVVDEAGMPLADVIVAASTDGRPDRTALTDARGYFRLLGLPVARYAVQFERIGLRTLVLEGVQVRLGTAFSLGETAMEVEAVGVEPLRVRAPAFGVDPTGTDVGSRIEISMSRDLPTGRDATDVLTFLPQANESFFGDPVNIGGSTGLANQFFIDGANVTDGYRGRTGTDLPFNFVEAVELKQGGYEAEYGQALGGLVNVVTKSGTNDFRFDAFGFLSGSSLAADPEPVPGIVETAAFSDYDVGVSVSGPILRDRLWFIAAYNPSFVKSDVVLDGFGTQTASTTRHNFAGKLDWRPGDRSRVSLSVFGDPTEIDEIFPAPTGIVLETIDNALLERNEGSTNASLNFATWAGESWLFEATAGYHGRRESVRGKTEVGRTEMFFQDFTGPDGTIVWSGGTGLDEKANSSRASLKTTATVFTGDHEIKLGGEFQDNRLVWDVDDRFGSKSAEDAYAVFFERHDAIVHNRVAALFVQDSWAVSRRWRLNLGVRWGGQWLDGGSGGTLQPIPDQWQPRIGLVFQPGELGTQKIFGYAGRFYQQLATLQPALQFTTGNDTKFVWYSEDPRVNPAAVDSVEVIQDPDIPGVARISGLRGEHLDEFVLGYERLIGSTFKIVLRGVHRVLRDNIQAALNPEPPPVGAVGNRGSGDLAHLGDAERNYTAAEVTLQHQGAASSFLISYVLSRHHGNYQGLLGTESGRLEGGSFGPNINQTLWIPAQAVNHRGLLPNDRPHALKVSGARRFDFGVTAGAFFSLSSGTPLNEFQIVRTPFALPVFRVERGTAGRTPAIWDLSFRVSYDLASTVGGRLVLDLLHIGNPQGIVDRDQVRFRNSICGDGDEGTSPCGPFAGYDEIIAGAAVPNPGFGEATAFQPPFTVRLGFEVRLGGQ